MIPFKKLPIGREDFKAVEEVMNAKSLSMGRFVAQFEDAFAEYVGAKYAIAVNSCTSALYLCLEYIYELTNGWEQPISIPSMTVPLVANAVIHSGHDLTFVDHVAWVGGAYQLYNTRIVDSAHEIRQNQDYSFDDHWVCYSFYPTKPICSAEGGMICTNDEDAADWLKKARWYGRNEGSSHTKNSWEYTIEFPGWKMNMTDIQAAIALSQLKKLPKLNKERRRVRDRYNKNLGPLNCSLYLYRINVESRDNFIKWMSGNGVMCGVHFAPLHKMEAYKDCQCEPMHKTMEEYRTTVSLPFYDSLLDSEVDRICELVHTWNNGGQVEYTRTTPGA